MNLKDQLLAQLKESQEKKEPKKLLGSIYHGSNSFIRPLSDKSLRMKIYEANEEYSLICNLLSRHRDELPDHPFWKGYNDEKEGKENYPPNHPDYLYYAAGQGCAIYDKSERR